MANWQSFLGLTEKRNRSSYRKSPQTRMDPPGVSFAEDGTLRRTVAVCHRPHAVGRDSAQGSVVTNNGTSHVRSTELDLKFSSSIDARPDYLGHAGNRNHGDLDLSNYGHRALCGEPRGAGRIPIVFRLLRDWLRIGRSGHSLSPNAH